MRNGKEHIELRPERLANGYVIDARLTLTAPPANSTDCAVELLFDAADAGTCYAFRFRELTGVRYCSLVRRESGVEEVLVDVVFGYSFGVPLDVRVTVDGRHLEARVGGVLVGAVNDVRRLRHDAIGFATHDTTAEVERVEVTLLHDDPIPMPTRRDVDVSAVPDAFGDWYVLSGDFGSRRDLHASLDVQRVTPGVTPEGYREFSVTWSHAGPFPVATVTMTPEADGYHMVAYHCLSSVPEHEVTEVMCGPLQHGRRIRGTESLGASELPLPACLVESGGRTWGPFVPADALDLADEVTKDPDDQPFGMWLREADGSVRPSIALPQYGKRAWLRAGETATYQVGVYDGAGDLYSCYRELLRTEYDYRPYRRNIPHGSLTDTVHNLVDLLATDPAADDSTDYQASPSGWWSRAKGFIDIENDQAVRATTTSVLLGAAYLTTDMDLYERRARPITEFHLSRNGYGWTPKHGYPIYAEAGRSEVCSTPFGVAALGALHAMTRRQNHAIAALATAEIGHGEDYWLRRAPMCAPLAAYRLTGEDHYLDEARARADEYIDAQVATAQTDDLEAHDFAIYYCADWIGLLRLFEETGERRYLDAAATEAHRFLALVFVRPVHDGDITVPTEEQYRDRQIELSRWWDPSALYDYPVKDIEPETVPRWTMSVTGQSFEALQTYRYSGPNHNPGWASHLLRLGHHADDALLRDVAHNAIVGRYTNYPGYYLRQHTAHHMKPDFPFTGPFDNSTIYYHHAPAQLGMTIDYLFAEHETRSGGEIAFPAEWEENFVWFRFRLFGHRPGRFYGDDDVWPWLPRDVVSLDTTLVDWLAGRRTDSSGSHTFYLSLANSSAEPVEVGVSLGLTASSPTVTVIADGVPTTATMEGNRLTVPVSGHGLTAVVVPVSHLPEAPMLHEPEPVTSSDTYSFDDDTRGILLARPDGTGWDAYVQSQCPTPATLRYSFDGGATWATADKPAHPAEWTVRVPENAASFTYEVGTDARPMIMKIPGAYNT